MLKARLDARKTGTPSASMIAPEESKNLPSRSSLSSLSMKHQVLATPISTQPIETGDFAQVNNELEHVEIQKDSLNILDKRDSVSKEEFNLLRSEMA